MAARRGLAGTVLLLAAAGIVLAQGGWMGSDPDDVFHRMETGEETLNFTDALSGEPVAGGEVTIAGLGTFTTDSEGKARFPAERDGRYKVTFRHPDYIKVTFPVRVLLGRVHFNRFSVSPKMELGHIRVVLDWGEEPRDLDAHFVKQGHYHISYRHKRVSDDGTAMLDRDDTDSFGPETVTCEDVDDDASYRYFVHDYTNRSRSASSDKLGRSRATIKVYSGEELARIIQVPEGPRGAWWHVFDITSGEIREVNRLLRQAP